MLFEKISEIRERQSKEKKEGKIKVKPKKMDVVVKRKISQEEIQFKKKFYELMFELDIYNKFKKTYLLNILEETNYGYYAHLYLANGLSFDRLQDKRIFMEQNLKCMWIMEIVPFKEYVKVQIVLNPVDERVEYTCPKIKPSEIYLGLSFSNKIQRADMNTNCMFLLAGATGSGKTRYIYQVLLSWILGCSPNEVWIYLADVAKNEYIQFKNVKHVKYYASEIEELYDMMRAVSKEFDRRKRLISDYREKGIATNIEEYNKVNKNKKLAYCIVNIDEFSVILPDKTDSKDEKEAKEFVLDTLKRLSKLGRSLGMFTFIATQKTTRDEIPSILKNMSAVRISFRANDLISSEVIMGNNSAMALPSRVAVYSLNGGSSISYLYTPKITIEMLKELIKPHIENSSISSSKESNLKGNLNRVSDDNSLILKSSGRVTSIPKGVDGREYIKSLKSKNILFNNGGDYNDYGS